MKIFLDYESNYQMVSEQISFRDFFHGEKYRHYSVPIEISIDHLTEGFINLVDLLFDKGMLTPEDIPFLANGWGKIIKIEKDTP